MRDLRKLSLVLLTFLLASACVCVEAQEHTDADPLLSDEPVAVVVAQESPESSRSLSAEDQLEEIWVTVVAESKAKHIKAVNDKVFELEHLMAQFGFVNLERFATELLGFSQAALDSQDREQASFYLRKAVQLAPQSAGILLEARRLASEIGTYDGEGLLLRSAHAAITQPHIVIRGLVSFIYPLLWAISLGLLTASGLWLAVSMVRLLRGGSTYLPSLLRGYLTAPLLLAALIAPLFAGPLWCLAAWAIILSVMLPGRQWVTFVSGVVLCLWGLLIPLREHGAAWLAQHGVESMLRDAVGVYQPGDIDQLRFLTKEQPQNGVAWFALGQVLTHQGLFEEARTAFLKSQHLLDDDHYPRAALGTLNFLTGDSKAAEEVFNALEKEGFSSAALFFNHSKAKFDLLDTAASRDYFDKANELDGVTVKSLQLSEEILGFNHPSTVASFHLPLLTLLKASLHTSLRSDTQVEQRVRMLSGRVSPYEIAGAGGVLIIVFLLFSGRRRVQRGAGYYTSYRHSPILFGMIRLIPAGSLALNEKPIRCIALCSLLALLLFPLLEWPSETKALIAVVRGFELHYTFIFWFLIVACSYVGFYAYDED